MFVYSYENNNSLENCIFFCLVFFAWWYLIMRKEKKCEIIPCMKTKLQANHFLLPPSNWTGLSFNRWTQIYAVKLTCWKDNNHSLPFTTNQNGQFGWRACDVGHWVKLFANSVFFTCHISTEKHFHVSYDSTENRSFVDGFPQNKIDKDRTQ